WRAILARSINENNVRRNNNLSGGMNGIANVRQRVLNSKSPDVTYNRLSTYGIKALNVPAAERGSTFRTARLRQTAERFGKSILSGESLMCSSKPARWAASAVIAGAAGLAQSGTAVAQAQGEIEEVSIVSKRLEESLPQQLSVSGSRVTVVTSEDIRK